MLTAQEKNLSSLISFSKTRRLQFGILGCRLYTEF